MTIDLDGKKSGTVRWGILGTGTISRQFALQLAKMPGSQFQGAASRQKSHAEEFAKQFGIRSYDSYAQLCEAPEIDIVYIATPTLTHKELCLLALRNGKAVLCEKPFTLDAQSACEVVDFARRQGLFCMEAMWMRFNPCILRLRELLHSGRIGQVGELRAELGWAKDDCDERSQEGRGAMLTFGCYVLSLAWFLLGPPAGYSASVIKNRHLVDTSSGMLLHYPETQVSLTASISTTQSNEIVIVGSRGSVRVLAPFIDATFMDISASGASPPARSIRAIIRDLVGLRLLHRLRVVRFGAGLQGEIAECVRCLNSSLNESPVMPLDETIAIHQYLDRIRLGVE